MTMSDNDLTPGTIPPAPDDASVFTGHTRVAHEFAQRYEGQFVHVYEIGWFYWAGTKFEIAQHGEPQRALHEMIRERWFDAQNDPLLERDFKSVQSASGTRGLLEIAAGLPEFAVVPDDMDAEPHFVNAMNGTLDLRTMQWHSHEPADRCTKSTNAFLSTVAEAPQWEAFLARVLPDPDVRAFVQRYVGVALLGRVREHKLLMLIGAGRNGKGTFYETINYVLGDYAITAEPELLLHREGAHPTGQMDLLGARWVVISESDESRRFNAATMKRLTGGDPIRARRMHKNFVEFEPSHTIAMVTNHKPKVSANDPAVWARIRVVNFDQTIPEQEQDKMLREKLQGEADGILRWILQGWQDYVANEYQLLEPQAVMHATEEYREDNDSIATFLDEFYVCEEGVRELQKDVRTAYDLWRSSNGATQMNAREFARVLGTHGIDTAKGSGNRAVFVDIRRKRLDED